MIYRPPKFNKDFIRDFTDFLGSICLKCDKLLIVGDFNVHVCCSSNPLAKDFLDVIDSFNFVQHVQGPTHEKGHTLDLILSLGLSVGDIETQNSVFSDHMFIHMVSAVFLLHVSFRPPALQLARFVM